MTKHRRQFSGICARLAAALHVFAVALVLVLPLGHAAWASEGGRRDAVISVQTSDSAENTSDGEAGLPCCGHASCHVQADVVFGFSVGPRAPATQQVVRPVGDDAGVSRGLHPPRKPPRLA